MAHADQTPMMQQYWRAKKCHPEEMLFFRMGDFYEMFHEDARQAAEILGIALTSRNKGPDAIPMAGVPVRSVKYYLRKLLDAGKRVAICEQLQDPATVKGLVDRDVVRVITPGTLVDEDCLDERAPLHLLALSPRRGETGLAWVDLSTGQFTLFESADARQLEAQVARIAPAECLVPEQILRGNGSAPLVAALRQAGVPLTPYPDWNFGAEAAERQLKEHFGVATLAGFGIERISAAVEAAGALLRYLRETQKQELSHITALARHDAGGVMQMDDRARRALEILATTRGARQGSLLAHFDRNATAMGARLLRSWLLAPLTNRETIEARLDAVEELLADSGRLAQMRAVLKQIADVERLAGRVALGTAHARDLVTLANSLAQLPALEGLLAGAAATGLKALCVDLGDYAALADRIACTLVPDPPLAVREGGLIQDGVSPELDELRTLTREGGAWLDRFQKAQIERTGIATLKVRYHRVFGYSIEVTHAQADKVPADYTRTQTLKNCERYTTPELKAYEARVLTAQDRMQELEYELFLQLREEVAAAIGALQRTAAALARLDVLGTFAHLAGLHRYVRPVLSEEKILRLRESRHPVLETGFTEDAFVPNDLVIEADAPVAIVTGPNMAGKSTYLRQAALLVLMAQMGSFVPAAEAVIGIVDRLFARVGAADDLVHGQSTFMVEMVETAAILHNATARSLIILDEVGRGTSTFDGMSIAWAVTEHIYEKIGARTLFATHYHELTELSLLHKGIRNLNVAVKEYRDEIIFLRKIVEGSTDRSYGLQVARLAALPAPVLSRAKEILGNLERQSVNPNDLPSFAPPRNKPAFTQLDLFARPREELLARLGKLDLNAMTPLEALEFLHTLKQSLP